MKKIISTKEAPGAIGPYSQGIKIGEFIFTSGQIPLNPITGELISDDVKNAAKMCLENLKAVLKEGGASLEDVVKTTVFLNNMEDFAAVNEVYSQYFTTNYPARSCVQVAKLPKDALVEIEAIAKVEE